MPDQDETTHRALVSGEPLLRQNPSRWKTGICLRFALLGLAGNVSSSCLERGRLFAPEKPRHPLLGDIGEEPYLGSIAIQR
jgi:hypothetical protein